MTGTLPKPNARSPGCSDRTGARTDVRSRPCNRRSMNGGIPLPSVAFGAKPIELRLVQLRTVQDADRPAVALVLVAKLVAIAEGEAGLRRHVVAACCEPRYGGGTGLFAFTKSCGLTR